MTRKVCRTFAATVAHHANCITRGMHLGTLRALSHTDNLANWIWFAELEGRDRLLDVCGGIVTMTASLARHFSTVYSLEPDPGLLAFSHQRFSQAGKENVVRVRGGQADPPFQDASFDCVLLHGVLDRMSAELARPQRRDLHRLLVSCHRLLRPRGCLYISASNPHWHRNLRKALRPSGHQPTRAASRNATSPIPRGIPSRASLKKVLQEIGFRRLRSYYVSPSMDQPINIIPATRRAVIAYERSFPVGRARGMCRRLLARLGLHSLLFPSQLMLAYR